MQFVKFKFTNPEDEAKVFLPLVHASRVVIVKEGEDTVFIVPMKSLAILDRQEVGYQVLGEVGFDGVLQALRSARTSQVQ